MPKKYYFCNNMQKLPNAGDPTPLPPAAGGEALGDPHFYSIARKGVTSSH